MSLTRQENGVKALVEFESEEPVTNLAPNLRQYLPSVGDVKWHVDMAYRLAPTSKISPRNLLWTDPLDSRDSSNSDSEPDFDENRTPVVCKPHTKINQTQHASPEFTTKTRK